jgi:hypothetical protein
LEAVIDLDFALKNEFEVESDIVYVHRGPLVVLEGGGVVCTLRWLRVPIWDWFCHQHLEKIFRHQLGIRVFQEEFFDIVKSATIRDFEKAH